MHRRGSCGVFFCLSVLCHNRGCEAVSAAAGHCSGAWPPPHYSECERNAPCTNRRNCAGGVFRSQAARPEYNKGTALVLVLRATTRENGAFYGNRPTGNAGKSMGSEIRIGKWEFVTLSKKHPCIPGSLFLYLLRSFRPAKNGSYGKVLIS